MTGQDRAVLPDIRVVAIDSLHLHEEADERRVKRLAARLSAEQALKNPPIVAPLSEPDAYVVLDGANRTSALTSLGVPDVVVQVVDYDSVTLSTWNHLVVGVPEGEFAARLTEIPGADVGESDLPSARGALADGAAAAFVVLPSNGVLAIRAHEVLAYRLGVLRDLVATYKGRADIFRVVDDDLGALRPYYSEIAGLVVFPPYTPGDILAMAASDVKLPTGITRHTIGHRALRLNIELAHLWSATPLAEKNRWLAEWMRHKLQASEIRVYEEATVLFDE